MVKNVQNLVVEHQEVQSETKMDRVCWRKLSDSHIRGALVRIFVFMNLCIRMQVERTGEDEHGLHMLC
jgi:hypothetical protein